MIIKLVIMQEQIEPVLFASFSGVKFARVLCGTAIFIPTN